MVIPLSFLFIFVIPKYSFDVMALYNSIFQFQACMCKYPWKFIHGLTFDLVHLKKLVDQLLILIICSIKQKNSDFRQENMSKWHVLVGS